MNPEAQAAQELGFKIGVVLGSLIVGSLIGLIPLSLGRKREDTVVGTIGFVACIVGQFLAGFLGAGSMAIGFVIAILVGPRRA